MKTIDFFCLSSRLTLIFVSLLVYYAGSVQADPPPPESFAQSPELVLTLSDKWLEPATQSNHEFQKSSRNLITDKSKTKPANIGCAMDSNPITTTNTSLTSQLVGKCNFNYHY